MGALFNDKISGRPGEDFSILNNHGKFSKGSILNTIVAFTIPDKIFRN